MSKKGPGTGENTHHAPKVRRNRWVSPTTPPDKTLGKTDPRFTSRWWKQALTINLSKAPVNTAQRTKKDKDGDE